MRYSSSIIKIFRFLIQLKIFLMNSFPLFKNMLKYFLTKFNFYYLLVLKFLLRLCNFLVLRYFCRKSSQLLWSEQIDLHLSDKVFI